MHLLSTRPGGYVDDGGQGVVRVAQTPGDIVILSAADTTLSLLSEAAARLPDGFPSVRLANLMWLRQPASVDMYIDDVLQHARAIVIDHLGAASDWAYVVDPALFPVIQMSYSQSPGGRQHPIPELFAVVSETSGLMFSNDVLPIKVRDEFAVGVNGARGIGKRNVA